MNLERHNKRMQQKDLFCYANIYNRTTNIDCDDVCEAFGYKQFEIHPFLIFVISLTCVSVMYCVTMTIIKNCCILTNRNATATTAVTETVSTSTQCYIELPLQQILIHPDNSLDFLAGVGF